MSQEALPRDLVEAYHLVRQLNEWLNDHCEYTSMTPVPLVTWSPVHLEIGIGSGTYPLTLWNSEVNNETELNLPFLLQELTKEWVDTGLYASRALAWLKDNPVPKTLEG